MPLPPQPADVPWPGRDWPEGSPRTGVDRERLARALDAPFAPGAAAATGETHALLAVHRGVLVAERYGEGCARGSPLISWSVAKSVTHALVGLAVRDGLLELHAPAPVPAWRNAGDPRAAITLEHLLRMVDGLEFREEYTEADGSHVIEMLFGAGKTDVAAYAESRPLAHPPGTVWNYSSGTTNVVTALLGRAVGGGRDGMWAFMRRELFGALGMESAEVRFDDAGTFIGSSFVFATARDFARFGLLYLRDGVWQGARLLPAGWVDHGRTPTGPSAGEYGAHWWLALDGSGIFNASGYRGQYLVLDPSRDLLLVRLGGSTADQRGHVLRGLAEVVACFPETRPSRA